MGSLNLPEVSEKTNSSEFLDYNPRFSVLAHLADSLARLASSPSVIEAIPVGHREEQRCGRAARVDCYVGNRAAAPGRKQLPRLIERAASNRYGQRDYRPPAQGAKVQEHKQDCVFGEMGATAN